VTAALDIDRVSHSFGSVAALTDVSLHVPRGGFTALLGVNGAGKTTLFSLITRLYDNTSGTIRVAGHDLRRAPRQALSEIMHLVRAAAEDDDIHIDKAVAESEKTTASRNMALLYYLQSHDNLLNPPEMVMGTYAHQCAIEMTCRQLARAGRMLAMLPDVPAMISPLRARRINALMMTCGQYDGSGNFAFRVGLPGKSGVGGGILLVAPGVASVAVWSPGLDGYGNSQVGTWLAERIAGYTGWSVFAP